MRNSLLRWESTTTNSRERFSEGKRTVLDGPFGEKDAIAGYWILQVDSIAEAVDWAKRVPFESLARIYPGEYGAEGEVEIRQVFELGDSSTHS